MLPTIMAKIDLIIPSLNDRFKDLRDLIPGDSYNWSWTRPLAQVKYLAIHHTAGPESQTPQQIANFHINSNGWGGIGYHFIISQDGTVYYVGDISTARANVANLNEQVLGICLVGNFTNGKKPTVAQIDSTRRLCDFFINHFPALSNVKFWDSVRGHKDLPGQSTVCPGDEWQNWRSLLITNVNSNTQPGSIVFNGSSDRRLKIADLYRAILGREPDDGGLETYFNSPMSIDEIMRSMILSGEHRDILSKVKHLNSLESQVSNLQDTVNNQKHQINSLNNTIDSLNKEIKVLKQNINTQPENTSTVDNEKAVTTKDTTFTLIDALFNLYKLFFPAREGNR